MHRKQHRQPFTAKIASLCLGASILACAPVTDTRGYVFDETQLAAIEKGKTTRATVIGNFGSPTTISSIDNATVYYIYSRVVTESYRAPRETERKVLAIYLTPKNVVRDYALYGLEDGIIVPIVSRTTATQGQELSVIGQIFGNIGRFGGEEAGP